MLYTNMSKIQSQTHCCAGGKSVSAWHDIPLWAEDGLLNFICEIPKESSAKMEVATVRILFVSMVPSNLYCCVGPCNCVV